MPGGGTGVIEEPFGDEVIDEPQFPPEQEAVPVVPLVDIFE